MDGAEPGRVSGTVGVLDAAVREPILAGEGEGPRGCGYGDMRLWVPHRRLVRPGRPAGCRHPFGCAPAWAGGMGRFASGAGRCADTVIPARTGSESG